eukprot:CAMPEP_0196764682 /NCGR_PEP_ID=MMETSP1095-20130614/6621_1 /TAXON_ID=96789 ORGANISM="Chromulina nebulosa, Strain UTEXLB2642" /NCGR_SAMPLE_ID=MMETSP1095 /ASSEMBLY_ACC=CAM_ASM_000446 /LENGTH=162 /DNA_ID=CAMNT_0042120831 /DNA_START=205 /DNA_END=693 /DNA_ORIENTATION=+
MSLVDINSHDDGWEMVDESFSVLTLNDENNTSFNNDNESDDEEKNNIIQPNPIGFSYRDALLTNKPKISPKPVIIPITKEVKKEWKPVLAVSKVPFIRKDREYGPNKNSYLDEIDEDGMWDLIYAHIDNKSSAAAAHYRTVTMLAPAQQAKKDLRISQKVSK